MPRVKKEKTSKKQKSLIATPRETRGKQSPKKIATLRQAQGKLPRNDKLSIPVYSLTGRAAGTMSLPKEIFGQKVNKKLLAQAMRVYLTNKGGHFGSTKGRGEVRGSTAKIFRQKGTGRARHGAITAPIFVGGGITFGPKPRKTVLSLPKKMKRAAIISALSSKAIEKNILGVTNFEKVTGKTKEIALFLQKVAAKKGALIITENKLDKLIRATRNIPKTDVLSAPLVNVFDVLSHEVLLISKDAVGKLSQRGVK